MFGAPPPCPAYPPLQVCISSVLQRHGALSFALMMTSRQCVSVLLSTLLFKHSLSALQW